MAAHAFTAATSKPPKCVAQLSRAVCVVATAVSEDHATGLPGQHRLDSRLQFVACAAT